MVRFIILTFGIPPLLSRLFAAPRFSSCQGLPFLPGDYRFRLLALFPVLDRTFATASFSPIFPFSQRFSSSAFFFCFRLVYL